MVSATELNKLKVDELQKLLKDKGLPSTGKKAELVQVSRATRTACRQPAPLLRTPLAVRAPPVCVMLCLSIPRNPETRKTPAQRRASYVL